MAGELKRLRQEVEYAIDGGCNPSDLQTALDLLGRAYKIIYDDGEAVCQAGTECMKWVEDYRAAKGE